MSTLLEEARRLHGPTGKPRGPTGPLIVTQPRGPMLHQYEDTEAFFEALQERHDVQTITTVIQVSDVAIFHPDGSPVLDDLGILKKRRPSDWRDVEVWAGPFQWGGMLQKEVGADGRPTLTEPTYGELSAIRDRHGALAARVVHYTDVLPAGPDGDPERPRRAIHGD